MKQIRGLSAKCLALSLAVMVLATLDGGRLLFHSASAAETNEKSYVGIQYPPLPDECRRKGGGMIFDFDDLAFEELICTNRRYVWLKRLVNKKGNKDITWMVIDSIRLPILKKGQEVLSADCDFRGKQDPLVFAIGTWKEKYQGGDLKNITYAIRINPVVQRIEVLETRHVQCGYTGEDRN